MRPARLFYSYSHKDADLRDQLESHLSILQRQNLIEPWHDRQIAPGVNWAENISEHIRAADIVLLLVSSDFIQSEYCYSTEFKLAMEGSSSGRQTIVPVFVRPMDRTRAPFEHLQGLPHNGVPITSWVNRDEGWADVAAGIRELVTDGRIHTHPPAAAWSHSGCSVVLPRRASQRRRVLIAVAVLFAAAALSATIARRFFDASVPPTTTNKKATLALAETTGELGEDLVLGSLVNTKRVTPLQGHAVLAVPGLGPVYTGGFQAALTLAHNHRGNASVTVTAVRLVVESFRQGGCGYSVSGDEIYGEGSVRPHQFFVIVKGTRIENAFRSRTGGVTDSVQPDNLLMSAQPEYLQLSSAPSNDDEELLVNVRLHQPGSYAIRFDVDYHSGGQDRTKRTETIRCCLRE